MPDSQETCTMLGMTTQDSHSARRSVPRDTWAARLLIARTERGLTQQQAADVAGVPRANWASWESGRHPHRQAETARKIADALDYDIGWLLWGGPLAGEQDGPDGGGGLPRLDSNQRPSDYTFDEGRPGGLFLIGEQESAGRLHRWNPLRRKGIDVNPWSISDDEQEAN